MILTFNLFTFSVLGIFWICTLLIFYILYLHSSYLVVQLLHKNFPRDEKSFILHAVLLLYSTLFYFITCFILFCSFYTFSVCVLWKGYNCISLCDHVLHNDSKAEPRTSLFGFTSFHMTYEIIRNGLVPLVSNV